MNILKIVLNIFKFLGVCSSTPYDRLDKSHKIFLLIWKIVHLFFAFALLGSIMYLNKEIFDQSSPIGFLLDSIQFIMPSITHHIILLESLLRYKTQRVIWTFPHKISGHLSKLGVDIQPLIRDSLWRFLMQIIFVQGFSCGTEFLIIYGILMGHGSKSFLYHWLFKLVPFSIGRMSLIFHGLFVTIIDTYVKAILTEIHYVGTLSKRKEHRVADATLTSKMLVLKEAYGDLALMTQYVNRIFTFSHMMNFLSIFITLAACFYWICSTILVGSSHPLEGGLCPLGSIVAISYITMKCQGALKNISFLPHKLNRIEITEERKTLRSAVQSFTLQIEHQPIRFSAGTIFELNSKLLADIFAVTCTYTVIFVQFMPY